MNITTAQYVASETDESNEVIKATIDGITHWVPIEPLNRHYAEILKQVADGDLTIADAD